MLQNMKIQNRVKTNYSKMVVFYRPSRSPRTKPLLLQFLLSSSPSCHPLPNAHIVTTVKQSSTNANALAAAPALHPPFYSDPALLSLNKTPLPSRFFSPPECRPNASRRRSTSKHHAVGQASLASSVTPLIIFHTPCHLLFIANFFAAHCPQTTCIPSSSSPCSCFRCAIRPRTSHLVTRPSSSDILSSHVELSGSFGRLSSSAMPRTSLILGRWTSRR